VLQFDLDWDEDNALMGGWEQRASAF